MSFEVSKGGLEGVLRIKGKRYQDARGSFEETFRASQFQEFGLPPFVQDNVSTSRVGVLRGLHFQAEPHSQGKLIQVLAGKAWSVGVDLRHGSPTWGQWEAFELSSDQPEMIYLPEGFAHGFLTLKDCIYVYKTTREYSPESERGLRWDDSDLAIDWPAKPKRLSNRDWGLPFFRKAFP